MAEDLADPMAVAAAAYRRFAERAVGVDRKQPTRLHGWTIGELIDHVAWGAAMEATAVRAAAGLPEIAAPSLEDAVAAFARAARIEIAADAAITLPAGTVPFAYAAPLFAFEAALHDLDLAHAVGAPDVEVPADEVAACEVVLGPMLDLVAAAPPAAGVTIDLIGLGAGIRLHAVDGGWRRAVPEGLPATTTVSGSPQEIVLFACGRIGADAVEVRGDPLHAERFKEYFPGP